jgi:hypothetical protein
MLSSVEHMHKSTKNHEASSPWEIQQTMLTHSTNHVLTRNVHLASSTQQAEQAGFTRAEITRRASQFFLKINKR